MPRNVIWVAGEAKWPPGIGNTYTGRRPARGLGGGGCFFLVLATASPAPDRHSNATRTTASARPRDRQLICLPGPPGGSPDQYAPGRPLFELCVGKTLEVPSTLLLGPSACTL